MDCAVYRYGALEGHSKPGLAHLYGDQVVQQWREGLTDRPPAMTPGTYAWEQVCRWSLIVWA
jgi:bisphosphoglycerate-dependent phosphoglycerate mutase